MPAIFANRIMQNYQIDGPGEGAPVLFINSLGTNLHIWDDVVRQLPHTFRVLRYDVRGHGKTCRSPGEDTIDRLVDDLIALLDALQCGRCLPIGLSIGGLIALKLALRDPARVGGLVLTHTAARIMTSEFWDARIALLQNQGLAESVETMLERWFTREWREANPEKLRKWQRMLRETDCDGYIGCCRVLGRTDLRDEITELGKMDTLVVSGSLDLNTTPDDGRWLAEAIPGARYRLLEGLAHVSCIEAPETFAKTIVPFIMGTDWYKSFGLEDV